MSMAKQAAEIAAAKTMRELTIAETHLVGAALGLGVFPPHATAPLEPLVPPPPVTQPH
jgi:hypothetical protein